MIKKSFSSQGLTLIELMISITIFGILVGLGMASYNEFNRSQTLKQAALNLKSNLREAQNKALSGEKPTTGCTVLDGFEVRFTAGNYTILAKCSPGPTYGAATTLSLPSGVQITTFPSPNPLILKVLGQGTNIVNETDIVLSGFSKTQTVTVTSSGEVR